MIYVTDMDGVLIDSKDATVAAYRSVGVEMPEDAWGKPVQSWFRGDPALHRRKTEVYPQFLQELGRPLAGVMWLQTMKMAGAECYIVTGASYRTVRHVLHFLEISVPVLGTQVTEPMRRQLLQSLSDHGIYVDDNHEFQVPDGWHFVPYRNDATMSEVFQWMW